VEYLVDKHRDHVVATAVEIVVVVVVVTVAAAVDVVAGNLVVEFQVDENKCLFDEPFEELAPDVHIYHRIVGAALVVVVAVSLVDARICLLAHWALASSEIVHPVVIEEVVVLAQVSRKDQY